MELWEDDLAGKIQNEYDPMIPNNFEMIIRQKRSEERSARDSDVSVSVLGLCVRERNKCTHPKQNSDYREH